MCVMAALLGFGIAQLTNMEVVNRLLRLQEQQDIMGRNSHQVAEVSNNTLRDCLAYNGKLSTKIIDFSLAAE